MNKKILFIDDDPSIRRSISIGLAQKGIDTEPCEDGMTALKTLETYMTNNVKLDAIVSDIRMPDINGIRLVKIIKYKYPAIPILLITGYADQYNMEEIESFKVNAFIEKPFTAEELGNHILKAVGDAPNETKSPTSKPHTSVSPNPLKQPEIKSAYMLIRVLDDSIFFETYKALYSMENVVYCDATKGDYDIFLLIQSEKNQNLKDMTEKIKAVPNIKSVDFLEVGTPQLDECTAGIIDTAISALSDEAQTAGGYRDMGHRVCSYLLMNIEPEHLSDIYPKLRLNENVIFCDYTSGKYNLILFVTGHYFEEIDKFIQQTITGLKGILKVKEYPVVSLFEM